MRCGVWPLRQEHANSPTFTDFVRSVQVEPQAHADLRLDADAVVGIVEEDVVDDDLRFDGDIA